MWPGAYGGAQLTVMPRGSFAINAVSSIVPVPLNLSSVVVDSVSDSIALHMPYLAPNDYTQDSLAVASILLQTHIHATVAGVTTIDSVSGRIASLTLVGISVGVLPEVIGDLTGLAPAVSGQQPGLDPGTVDYRQSAQPPRTQPQSMRFGSAALERAQSRQPRDA